VLTRLKYQEDLRGTHWWLARDSACFLWSGHSCQAFVPAGRPAA
jgi:hypothetical protein